MSESPSFKIILLSFFAALVAYCIVTFGLSMALAYCLVKFLGIQITIGKLALIIWLARLLLNVNVGFKTK